MKIDNTNNKPDSNIIINGAMELWQRDDNQVVSSAEYVADRFENRQAGTMTRQVLRSSDVPSSKDFDFQYSQQHNITISDNSVAASDFMLVAYKVEGRDFAKLAGKTGTLSFWVKSNVTGEYSLAFRNSGTDRSYVTTYTIDSADTWEKKSITVTFNQTDQGTWDFENGIGLEIIFTLMAGTDFQGATNQWTNTANFSSAGQVNVASSDTNYWNMTGVMLNFGGKPAPFRRAGDTFADEVLMAQRYYEKSYSLTTNPATDTEIGLCSGTGIIGSGNSITMYTSRSYATTKRAIPSVTIYSKIGSSNTVSLWNGFTNVGSTPHNADNTNETAIVSITANAATPFSNPVPYAFHFTSDAEL